ncbi:MAG: TonB-dependent receptor [Bacteroidetes bacterium]|nr:MAG: TonB-dependent receptor [Bacteroidota bacterium]
MGGLRQRFLLSLLIGLLCVVSVNGQEKERISGEFTDLRFDQFVAQVESQCNFHFFYDSSELDSFRVNVTARNLTVSELLLKVFHNSGFYYSIDSLGYIVVNKRPVRAEIVSNFFKKNTADTAHNAETVLFEEPATNTVKLQSSLENKLIVVGTKSNYSAGGKSTLAGYVRDARNGEAISGASVYVDTLSVGVLTDQFGYYSIVLPRGRHTLHFSSVGMKDTKRQIMLYSEGKINVELEDAVVSLKAVTVVSEKNSRTRNLQMGVERLNIKTIKQVAVAFGEPDILRVVLTLPGVTSVGEASTGFNVRGGSTDQNLILFNDATIYNPTHLFGFFSAFNPDIVKSVELYKSTIPEKYGGRLSSVLDVASRDGNNKKWTGVGGIGPLTSRLTIEGPLIKDKTSVIIGGRTTYSNWLLHAIPTNYSNSDASFYDVNLHITHNFNPKNSLYLSGYLSHDQFRLNSDTLYKYGNMNANLKYKHVFNNKLYGVLTTGIDHYQYSVSSTQVPVNGYKLAFDINQVNFRADFNYALSNRHTLDFGLTSIYYMLHPGSLTPEGKGSLVAANIVPKEQALESTLYLGDRYNVSSKLSFDLGLRYSLYNYLGPRDVYQYVPGLPKQQSTIQDIIYYGAGKNIKTYQGTEYRVAARYILTDNSSIKASFNTLRQYIHMLSNTTAISPTDIWKLSDSYIQPQSAYQVSLGYYRNFKSNTIETSVEVYYKEQRNYLDYRSGAKLVLNSHVETDVINTKGKAYGIEFLVKKTAGKLNGWLSYTYSRALLAQDDPYAGEIINKGQYYPANYDKPNNVNFIGNYRFSLRYSVSVNVIYSTGRPVTLPLASFYFDGAQRVYYSDRNQYRIPDYFRTDLSFNIEGNHRVKKITHNSWSFGVYNLTGRQNAYSVYFTTVNGVTKGYKMSIFDTPVPFVTYNFRF